MKIMKRLIALFLVVTCLFSTLPLSAYALSDDEFDINDYTLDDFMEMNYSEKEELFGKFIERYNPYGIKEKLAVVQNKKNIDFGITPYWSSGNNYNHTEQEFSTHHSITMVAFARMVENHGFYHYATGQDALVLILLLSAASGLPDMDERDNGKFRSHFYDPDTRMNYDNQTSPTAKTEAQRHFDNAFFKLRDDFYMDLSSEEFIYVIQELGRALHYIQDACEPHHATNKTAYNSNHALFEKYVEGITEELSNETKSSNCYYHDIARTGTAGDLVHKAAVVAKPKYNDIKIDYRKYSVASSCYWESVYFSEALIYKLFYCAKEYYDRVII